MERIVERPAALDVHKASVMACVRVPATGGGRDEHVEQFPTTVHALLTLADWLEAHGVTQVAMEATGVYWKPVWAVLEDRFACMLVNARRVKQVPGRKTDVLDGLAPGTYSWFVLRSPLSLGDDYASPSDLVYSAKRMFTVLGPRLTRLTLSHKSDRGTRSKYPGSTEVVARTTPYARVRITVSRRGHRSAYYFHANSAGTASLNVAWSCARPGGTYKVTAVASDQFGAHRQATTRFKPVSRGRCSAMRRAEAAARRAREKRRAAAERRAERQAAEEQAARERRFRRNCRAINGIPRIIQRADGPYTVCAAPFGGLLTVPY